MREAGQDIILPLYRRLTAGDIEEKAPGDLVTVADRRAEEFLTGALAKLLPGSTVVGEEAVAADVAVLDRLRDAGPVWLVDPVDGTANFAAGQGPFAVMVALVESGVTRTGWILDLVLDRLAVADAGAGAYLDGVRITADQSVPPLSALRGNLRSRYLPLGIRTALERRAALLGEALPGTGSAAREYPDVVTGVQDFSLFWRANPWDHAAGSLLVREAGAVIRRLDGTDYVPTDARPGLLVARNDGVWQQLHAALLTPESGFPAGSASGA